MLNASDTDRRFEYSICNGYFLPNAVNTNYSNEKYASVKKVTVI